MPEVLLEIVPEVVPGVVPEVVTEVLHALIIMLSNNSLSLQHSVLFHITKRAAATFFLQKTLPACCGCLPRLSGLSAVVVVPACLPVCCVFLL